MTLSEKTASRRLFLSAAASCMLAFGLLLAFPLSGASETTISPKPSGIPTIASPPSATPPTLALPPTGIRAFHPGEVLTYVASWSKMVSAGTVTMTVEREELPGGREVLKFVVQGRTTGAIDKVFPVNDTVQSVFDPLRMQSLSYSLRESYGKRKRLRVTEFDHAARTAVYRLNEDPPRTVGIPDPVYDGLSMLYALRTRGDLLIGKQLEIDVLDSGKTWTMQFLVLAREMIKTAAGDFDAVKISASSREKGTDTKKGEILLWLTDDDRKVPVLMKTKIKVGSFVFELADMRPGTRRIVQ
ncbi:MAG: DUF3108 domain-containing protein [Nitrospiraceae bacterium]|nr:DUF3108 domain-containing protein [Nitrospiraceae bacterium]